MTLIARFFRFWYDFIVGDDATLAIGVVLTMGATALLTSVDINAWWLMLAGVAVALTFAVFRVVRAHS